MTMEYLFVIWESPDVAADETRRKSAMDEMGGFMLNLVADGTITGGGPLLPGGAQVRRRKGKMTVTDGPFTESREVIGGYFVVRADSRDQALEIATRCPASAYGAVEVHPIMAMG